MDKIKQKITQVVSNYEFVIQKQNYGSKVNFDLMFTFINSKPVWNWILWISNSRIGIFKHTNSKIYKIYDYRD